MSTIFVYPDTAKTPPMTRRATVPIQRPSIGRPRMLTVAGTALSVRADPVDRSGPDAPSGPGRKSFSGTVVRIEPDLRPGPRGVPGEVRRLLRRPSFPVRPVRLAVPRHRSLPAYLGGGVDPDQDRHVRSAGQGSRTDAL